MKRSSGSKALNWLFLFAILFIVGFVWNYIYASNKNSQIRTGVVQKGELVQRVTIAGSIIPTRKTVITAPYDGYVKQMFVKIGQKIKRGDPVVSVVQSLSSPETVFPIRAPYDGTVVQVMKSEGEFVKAGDPKEFIARVDDLGKLMVAANAPEVDMVKIKIGQEAVIKATSIVAHSYKGIVRSIAMAAIEKERWGNQQQVEYPITLEMIDADGQLRPGMSALIDIIAHKKENVLTLQHEFVNEENGKSFITLKDGSRREIQTGLQNEQEIEILSGAKEGDEVRQIDFYKLVEKGNS